MITQRTCIYTIHIYTTTTTSTTAKQDNTHTNMSSSRKMEDDGIDIPVCIFKVPDALSASKPQAYVPQLVGLGPYHHYREDLKPMRTFKLAELRKILRRFPTKKIADFGVFVHVLIAVGAVSTARPCYATPVDLPDEELGCLIAADGLYLLELLRRYVNEDYDGHDGSGFFCDLIAFGAREHNKSPRDITAGDVAMLENQIPIRSLKLILTAEHWETIERNSVALTAEDFDTIERDGLTGDQIEELVRARPQKCSIGVVTHQLPEILLQFAAEVSPLKVLADYPRYKVLRHSHLLDLIYALVTLRAAPKPSPEEEEKEAKSAEETARKVSLEMYSLKGDSPVAYAPQSILGEIFGPVCNLLLDTAFIPLKIPVKLVQGLIGLPWSKIWLYTKDTVNGQTGEEEENSTLPGALELRRKGVTFTLVNRVSEIEFDESTRSLCLPAVRLGPSSEVVLRNLAAYEAAVRWKRQDSLPVARFLQLMSDLVTSHDDVETLVGAAVLEISSSSMSSEEVVGMFTAMGSPARPTNAKHIDKAVAQVVRYYNGLRVVSISRLAKKCLCWCSVVAVVLALAVLVVAAFWSIYKWFFNSKTLQAKLQVLYE